jgi:hypothetical protein
VWCWLALTASCAAPSAQGFEPVNRERYAFRLRTSPSQPRGADRPEVAFADLLTEEERALLAVAEAVPKAGGSADIGRAATRRGSDEG